LYELAWLTKGNLSELVEKLMLVLRDGKKLLGVLRSWDQFGRQELRLPRIRFVLTGLTLA